MSPGLAGMINYLASIFQCKIDYMILYNNLTLPLNNGAILV